MEKKLIEATLERFGGHRAKTAKALGIGLRTLSGKLRHYGYAPREKIGRLGRSDNWWPKERWTGPCGPGWAI